MKFCNLCKKYGSKLVDGAVVMVASAGSAMAALSTESTAAMADAKTDSAAIGGLALTIIIGIAAFKYCRRAV